MVNCPNCGEENPERFKLCGFCGTPLAAAATPAPEVRKTVTVVFSDLQGSTNLGERLDSETVVAVLNRYFAAMRVPLERHGGTLEKFIGDAIMAVFGLPKVHEDDALRAVRAAAEMRTALVELNQQLEIEFGLRLVNRTGVNTGEVISGDASTRQRLVTGDVVNVAARLEQAAPGGEVLIGESTYRLVRDAVTIEPVEPLALKGKSEPVPAYRLIEARGLEGVARRTDTPIVGRRAELATLAEALNEAADAGQPRMVTVMAPAGVGKSRLLEEFVRRAGREVPALRGRCLSYGEGITFWPLAEIVRDAAGIADEDDEIVAMRRLEGLCGADRRVSERLAAVIGLAAGHFAVEETFWAARRFLEVVSGGRPLILIVNDLHWAEPTFLDLLRELVTTAAAPLVLVGSSRPDLVEEHPDFDDVDGRSRRIVLGPLTADESSEVIGHLLGAAVDPRLIERIVTSSEGNPLYVEQMLSMLIDDGALHEHDGRWTLTGDPGELLVPPSISALLSARVDRLEPRERALLERASIVGQVFYPAALAALGAADGGAVQDRQTIQADLAALSRRQLIASTESTFNIESAYRFLHILIRDAAYNGILKRRRADLHERFADWMTAEAGIRVAEQSEIIGHHLEQATLHRAEVGLADEHSEALARRAADALGFAGQRAFDRGDMPAAGNLLRRAGRLLPFESRERAELLSRAGEALADAGELADADATLDDAIAGAEAGGDAMARLNAEIVRLSVRYATEGADEATILDALREAVPVLTDAGDEAGLHRAYRLETLVHFTAGRYGAAERAALQTIEHARLSGDRTLQTRFLGSLAICALYGPTPVPEAIARTEALVPQAGDDRKAYSLILTALSHLRAMQGDFATARDLYGNARAILEELGWKMMAALTSIDSGVVELLAGDPVAAERELRGDYETLEAMGERNYISTTAAFLADALSVQGRNDEAIAFTEVSEEIAGPDDVSSQSLWRLVRGRVLARRGELEAAEALAREGLAIIRTSDEPDSQGNALVDLAEVLRLAGREADADAALREALALFEAKGNQVSAGRARTKLADAGVTAGRD